MDRPEYPELGRREMMLWAVHEWVQDRPAGEDMIWFDRVATLVGGGEYVDPMDDDPAKQAAKKFQAEQVNLFLTLEREGLIDADVHTTIDGLPFTSAIVRGLHERGLALIQEYPDAQRALLQALDGMSEAIGNLSDVDEEQKDAAEKAAEEIKDLVRNMTPPAAVQVIAAFVRALGGP